MTAWSRSILEEARFLLEECLAEAESPDEVQGLAAVLDLLADCVEAHFQISKIPDSSSPIGVASRFPDPELRIPSCTDPAAGSGPAAKSEFR